MIGWLDEAVVLDRWPDAPSGAELADLLTEAHEVLIEYAPAIPPLADGSPGPVPKRYAKAQLLMAKHIYARALAGNAESIGPDGYQINTYPLVLEARALLRPKKSPFAGMR
jgi:hypothetical protein